MKLGDFVERALAVTGIDRLRDVYEQLTHTDCGCAGRKERLNKISDHIAEMAKKVANDRNIHPK